MTACVADVSILTSSSDVTQRGRGLSWHNLCSMRHYQVSGHNDRLTAPDQERHRLDADTDFADKRGNRRAYQ